MQIGASESLMILFKFQVILECENYLLLGSMTTM